MLGWDNTTFSCLTIIYLGVAMSGTFVAVLWVGLLGGALLRPHRIAEMLAWSLCVLPVSLVVYLAVGEWSGNFYTLLRVMFMFAIVMLVLTLGLLYVLWRRGRAVSEGAMGEGAS